MFKVLKCEELDGSELPDIIPPPGLSKERQLYLYTEIRQFVDVDKRDQVCPPPGNISCKENGRKMVYVVLDIFSCKLSTN